MDQDKKVVIKYKKLKNIYLFNIFNALQNYNIL